MSPPKNKCAVLPIFIFVGLICLGAILPNHLIINTVQPLIGFVLTISGDGDNAKLNNDTPISAKKRQIIAKKEQQYLRNTTISVVKKTGHLGLFFMLGLFVGKWSKRSTGKRYVLFVAGGMALLLFAAFSEGLQYFAISRTPRISDWYLDCTGAGVGYLLVWARFRLRPTDS